MKSKLTGIIVPMLIEPNGKMERILEVARSPKAQEAYEKLLKRLKCRPEEFSRKLREVVWKDKNLDEIFVELER